MFDGGGGGGGGLGGIRDTPRGGGTGARLMAWPRADSAAARASAATTAPVRHIAEEFMGSCVPYSWRRGGASRHPAGPSMLRHRYHDATVEYGDHGLPILSTRLGLGSERNP